MDVTLKASRTLINENQVVCVKTLTVKSMMKNPKLAKHIADTNWGEFVRQLKYKSEWADRMVVDINAAKNIKIAGLAGLACGATGTGTTV